MGNAERIFSAVFGALLLGLGIFGLFQDHLSFGWRLGGSFLLALLGSNSICAAYRGKASWLSRLGPLPWCSKACSLIIHATQARQNFR
jgi:hypothetical protein